MARTSSSRDRYKKRGNHSNTIAILVFVLSLAIAGAITWQYMSAKSQAEKVNSKTFCTKDKPSAITVILIDHTDNINPVQKAVLEKRLWDIAKNIRKNSLIQVYSVNSEKQILHPQVSLCNPGDGAGVSSLTGNAKLTQKRYEEKFQTPLATELDGIVSSDSAKTSPIMKSIQSVAIEAFMGVDNGDAVKKLIIVSDMLENTNNFSVYKGIPKFELFKQNPYWASVKSDLSNVEVEIDFLHRDGAEELQGTDLRDFWMQYFKEQDVSYVNFVPIEG